MKFVTFQSGDTPRLGALVDGGVADLGAVAPSLSALIMLGASGVASAKAALPAARIIADARLLAPLKPGKVLCCGINYRSHAEENPNAKMPSEPFFFAKLPSSVIGPDAPIRVPPMSQQVDYEAEFAVVIGKRLSRASEAEVMPAIFGYTLLNDVSARDVQFKDAQITIGKNFDGFAPIGPCVVSVDELTQPDKVRLISRLNGQVMQNGSTSEWLFSLPRLLSFLSQVLTLDPGDIVTTGTPAGVGYFKEPQVFMKAGDTIEIEGDKIGVLRNRLVD